MEPRGSHLATILGVVTGLAFLLAALLTFPWASSQYADGADYRVAERQKN